MKKSLFLTLFVLFLFSQSNFAQLKVGYVDSEYLIKQLPDAQDIQSQLDNLIIEWKEELSKLEKEFQLSSKDYEGRKLILSEEKAKSLKKELDAKEKEIEKFREAKFGLNGELFRKQNELMNPIQNRIFKAIKEIAEEDDYDFIFDRSGDMMFLFAKEKYDLTSKVLEKIK